MIYHEVKIPFNISTTRHSS